MYEDPPVNIVQGYLSATMLLFFVMVWFGYSFLSDFDTTTEHLLTLQINSKLQFAASKILFLVAVTLALSVMGGMVPVIIQAIFSIRGATYIPYGIRVADFFGGVFLHFIVGILGAAAAFLFHPNPTKQDSTIAVLALILFAILAFVKHRIFEFEGALRHLLLVFTPVYEIMSLFSDKRTFAAGDLLLAAAYGIIYFLIIVALGYWIYIKRVYGPIVAVNSPKKSGQ